MFERLWNVFRQRRVEDEIRQEMASHIAFLEEDERAQGADPQAARRNARLRFGNDAVYGEQTREANLTMWFDDLLRDGKFAYRQLLRNPGFAAAGVLLLGLGIGVNAAIFTVISSVILRPLAVPEPDRLVSVREKSEQFEMPESCPICSISRRAIAFSNRPEGSRRRRSCSADRAMPSIFMGATRRRGTSPLCECSRSPGGCSMPRRRGRARIRWR